MQRALDSASLHLGRVTRRMSVLPIVCMQPSGGRPSDSAYARKKRTHLNDKSLYRLTVPPAIPAGAVRLPLRFEEAIRCASLFYFSASRTGSLTLNPDFFPIFFLISSKMHRDRHFFQIPMHFLSMDPLICREVASGSATFPNPDAAIRTVSPRGQADLPADGWMDCSARAQFNKAEAGT